MQGLRYTAIGASVLTYGLIVLGALVRATDSGLSCPDWPTCYGHWVPLPGDIAAIPGITYSYGQVMAEWVHRLIAGVMLGPLVLVIALLAFRQRARDPRLPFIAAVLVLLLLIQGALGGLTVLDRNSPWSVALHLGNALLVLATLLLLVERTGRPVAGALPRGFAIAAAGTAATAWLAMLSAAMTTKMGAALACATWPSCDGLLIPDLTDPLIRIHFAHRTLAALTALAVLGLLVASRHAPAAARRIAMAVALVVTTQVGLGALVVVWQVPLFTAVLHMAVGVLVFVLLTLLTWRSFAVASPNTRESRMASPYTALEGRFKRLADIEGALAVLSWDQAVCMPKGGSRTRGEQMATLKRLAHDALTAPETGELLAEAAEFPELDEWRRANLREMGRRHVRATAIDPALVESLARATNSCELLWREARALSDFAMLRPELDEVVRLVREAAGQAGAALDLAPYDALLDEHQPGLRSTDLERLFAPLQDALPGMVDAAMARQQPAVEPKGPFPIDRQRILGKRMIESMGFDFNQGRLDESTHPFCGGTPEDIRMTTRYREDDAVSALMGMVHETGHALYEAGLPRSWLGQPVGESRGMAVHESQSLIVEMQTCRSPEFIRFLAGQLQHTFGDDPAWAPDNLVRLYNRVERSLIRVEADEITYPLHIVLRWRLERALMVGDLALGDLPGAWNDGMRDLLGVVPPNDRVGCLQDIHWPVGGFGYFPCYTLGAMLAAQLFKAAERELPDLRGAIAQGDTGPMLSWLRANVHGQGCRLPWSELVVQATGSPLSPEPFLAHLRHRYLGEG